MKKASKSKKAVLVIIILFVAIVSAIFITISVVYSKNSTQKLCGFVRVECEEDCQIRVVFCEKEMTENSSDSTRLTQNPLDYSFSKPIFEKNFSDKLQSENLPPIIFSSSVGMEEYGYKITLTNTKDKDIDYDIQLVQKGTEKECCLSSDIEVSNNNDGEFKVGKKCSGEIKNNMQKSIVFLFRSTKSLEDISAAPCSEFEFLIKVKNKNS